MAHESQPMRINQLRIQNYRTLRDVTFKELAPLTVLCGPNGSGKSTVFDVFAFLYDAFTSGLRASWDRRNRISEIRSRGSTGPVTFELKYRASISGGNPRLVTYRLAVDERAGVPVVVEEKLQWTTALGSGRPRDILSFENGRGTTWDEETGEATTEELASPDLLAVSALGQFQSHPRVKVLRDFITGWYLSYLSVDDTRNIPTAGPARRLSQTGDNLPNVVQYLQENHPDRLNEIFEVLARRVPWLERVESETLADGRLLLRLKDAPFSEPVLSRYVSDGTLKLLAYLIVLYDPEPPTVIGIEEPENQLHPKLLPILAEEIRQVSSRSQVLVTTHSPEFVNEIRPKELWTISRGADGYAGVRRASDDEKVLAMVKQGAQLGWLWNEGYLTSADPADV
ncbi:ATPase [Actinobacteria bacterium YIM 96077]|uniref:ATPase n=1 Tax=Phytoactinopolyspora halophila TaxID=1981511 RepID=A0A329QIX6_9ACTN|nr:AAA family ATPase [Phytoactinopolyspora halophila]AYY13547.1 ATPase [Actinobacteria bacterium YIM 96077]RAW12397.1 ATPase [Phytoactinopolyspora halophila]